MRKSQEVYTNKKWFICIAVAILVVGVFTAAGIYFGCELTMKSIGKLTPKSYIIDEYLKANEPNGEKVYGGQFRVRGRELVSEPGTIFHFSQTEQFRKPLHQLLDKGPLRNMYRGTEVFLLET